MRNGVQELFNTGKLVDTLGRPIYGVGPVSQRPGGDFVFPFEDKYSGLSYRVAEFKIGYLSDKFASLLKQSDQCEATIEEFKKSVANRDAKSIIRFANDMVEFASYLTKIQLKIVDSVAWISDVDLAELKPERVQEVRSRIQDVESAFKTSGKTLAQCAGLLQKIKGTIKIPASTNISLINGAMLELGKQEEELRSAVKRFDKFQSHSPGQTPQSS